MYNKELRFLVGIFFILLNPLTSLFGIQKTKEFEKRQKILNLNEITKWKLNILK